MADLVYLYCINCHSPVGVRADGPEMYGIFNVFCPGGNCEDEYAWKEMFGEPKPKSEAK